MFLQILRSLESFSAELALVWLQWDMDSNMGCDMITFDSCCSTLSPCAGQVEIVCRLSTDMSFADVFLLISSVSFTVSDTRFDSRIVLLLKLIVRRNLAIDIASFHLRHSPLVVEGLVLMHLATLLMHLVQELLVVLKLLLLLLDLSHLEDLRCSSWQ